MRRAALVVLAALLLAGCARPERADEDAPPPIDARAVASTTLPRLGEPVRFEAPGLKPGERAEWAFGDGGTATGAPVVHLFATPGRYLVLLRVIADDGREATNDAAPLSLSVLPPTVDARAAARAPPPFAIAASSAQVVQAGAEVTFDGRGSGIWRGPPFELTPEEADLSWDFGGGDVRVGSVLGRVFPEPGLFPVTLTVRDGAGAASSYVLSVCVLRQEPPALALRDPTLLVEAAADEPTTLDPARLADDAGAHVVQQVYERLYAYAPGAPVELVPELAEAMPEANADRTTLTVRLREGVTFHDGTALTAHAVKASLDRLVRLDDPQGPAWLLAPILRSVEVVDERTVRFQLAAPDPAFPHRLAHEGASIVSKGAIQDERGLDTRAVGTGPFRLAPWSPGQPVVLERFAGHWRDPPALAAVVRMKVDDLDTRVRMLASGQADSAVIPPGAEERVLGLPGVRMVESPSWATSALGFNQEVCGATDAEACAFRHPDSIPRGARGEPDPRFFADPDMREAWSLAFDREAYARDVLRGHGELLAGPLPAGMLGHDPALAPPPRDLEGARAALARTKHADGFRITLFYNEGNAVREATARLLAQNVREISPGIEIDVRALPHATGYLAKQRDRALPIEFLAWTPDHAFPDGYAVTFGHSELGVYAAHLGYRNAELDTLLDGLLRETDEERLAEGYRQATRRMNDDHAYVWLAQGTNLAVQRDWVRGDAYHPLARGQPLIGDHARVVKEA